MGVLSQKNMYYLQNLREVKQVLCLLLVITGEKSSVGPEDLWPTPAVKYCTACD